MPADICKGIWVSIDEESFQLASTLLRQAHLFFEVGGKVGGRSRDFSMTLGEKLQTISLPSDMIEAPESLKSLHPICIEKAFSAGRVGCPLRNNAASPVRRTPGVLIGPLPFAIDEEAEGSLPFPSFDVKVSRSDRDCPDTLETIDSPCASSTSHGSCVLPSAANISPTQRLVRDASSQHRALLAGQGNPLCPREISVQAAQKTPPPFSAIG